MSQSHMFNVEHAEVYGLEEAVMLQHFIFWIQKNAANKKHLHNGRYWTYNKLEAFTDLFPYWTYKQIRRILDSLERQNIIIKGNFNQNGYDRTAWYALADAGLLRICPNGQMEMPVQANGNARMGRRKCPNGQNTDQLITNSLNSRSTSTSSADADSDFTTATAEAKPPSSAGDVHRKLDTLKANELMESWIDLYKKVHGRTVKLSSKEQQSALALMERALPVPELTAIAVAAWIYARGPANASGFHDYFTCRFANTLTGFEKHFDKIVTELSWREHTGIVVHGESIPIKTILSKWTAKAEKNLKL